MLTPRWQCWCKLTSPLFHSPPLSLSRQDTEQPPFDESRWYNLQYHRTPLSTARARTASSTAVLQLGTAHCTAPAPARQSLAPFGEGTDTHKDAEGGAQAARARTDSLNSEPSPLTAGSCTGTSGIGGSRRGRLGPESSSCRGARDSAVSTAPPWSLRTGLPRLLRVTGAVSLRVCVRCAAWRHVS
eukprot:2789290-Rhodomonas_salina.1